MPQERSITQIELRSEEVQDILNRPPNWMISWGNTVLLSLIVMLLVLTYFIRYSDVINGTAIISTDYPPVYISSKVNGRIGQLHVINGQPVSSGQLIAQIDNPVPAKSIEKLRSYLSDISDFLSDENQANFPVSVSIDLYQASSDFLNLRSTMDEYYKFLFSGIYEQKLGELNNRLDRHEQIKQISLREAELNKVNLANAKERFAMQQQEYEMKIVSKSDYLNAKSAYNEVLKHEESMKKSLIQTELTLQDLSTEIRNFKYDRNEQFQSYRKKIEELTGTLQNFITRWESDFNIVAPLDGRLEFIGRIKTNQYITANSSVCAIVPTGNTFEVEVKLPSAGFGKVKVGQEVRIKADKFSIRSIWNCESDSKIDCCAPEPGEL